ncbi:MAG: F420-dependent methylenetetrahydromethanopterin dehydrogenase [Archaeoglobi archaeon]|nr:F420-dependent methylenetetrahydromethanopterin dehydrogenase [Candidatus Mnemosynella sp.]
MTRIGFVKLGNIGISTVVDLILDERADREDIEVRTISSGSKMSPEVVEDLKKINELSPELLVVVSPNASLPGPKKMREAVEVPCIIISDAPAKKAVKKLEEGGFGYIIISGDPMIGARREFLDPTEMTLFNAEVLKILSVSGVVRIVQDELNRALESIKRGELYLPKRIVEIDDIISLEFSNPYAKAKAVAAYSIAEKVAELNVRACFMEKEREKYISMVAAAHEMIRIASKLSDEARELEKAVDGVIRTPHSRDGRTLFKRALMEVFQK